MFILFVVMANSVMLASHSYEFRIDPSQTKATEFEVLASKIFTGLFIAEFVLKVIAMGFVMKKYSYLRSFWNVLDFVCMITAIVEQVSSSGNSAFMMLRVLRVLKPLRSIKAIPSLQRLVQGLFSSFAGLVNVYMFLTFILSFFAIFGMYTFNG